MTCKKHCTDLSSIIGVCASCLRQRLITLIITQEQSETQSLDHNHHNSNSKTNTNKNPERSGSPYISRLKYTKSVNPIVTAKRPCNKPRLNHSVSDRRFHNSPQIAIATGGCIGGSSRKNPTVIKFPSISNLFRSNNNSRNVDTDSNPRVSVSVSVSVSTSTGATSSPSWISNVRRNNNTTAGVVRNRGMSPVQTSDDDEDVSGGSIGRYTPAVRCGGVDGGYSGDVRVPAAAVVVPHLSYAKSFSGNRSRKLADFGRSDPNRLF